MYNNELDKEIQNAEQKGKELLEKFEKNFIRHRYPFEAYEKMTETDFFEYGKLWVELEAPEKVDPSPFSPWHPAQLERYIFFPDSIEGRSSG